MDNHDNSPNKRQGQDTYKTVQLKEFVTQSKYIDIKEQPAICRSFGLPYLKYVFQIEYRQRFYQYLKEHTTTVASVYKATAIPEKYLCQCKAHYEKQKLLAVARIGRCPASGSSNVQFLTTNKNLIESLKNSPVHNQLNLFENEN